MSVGLGELLLILLVALIVLGPERLPQAARAMGRALRGARDALRDVEDSWSGITPRRTPARDASALEADAEDPRPPGGGDPPSA